jgi:hypothetical protein
MSFYAGGMSYCTATVVEGSHKKLLPTGPIIPYFSRRKMLSINHLYAFCRATQGAYASLMQTQKEVFDVKSWKAQSTAMEAKMYLWPQMRMTLGFFSVKVKVGKKCVETCKNIWAFF